MLRSSFRGWVWLALLFAATASAAQTFDVNGQSSSTAPSNTAPAKKRSAPKAGDNETGMGWGQSIEVAREARAAQSALQHSDWKSAVAHAQRAVQSAPQNPDLWFTLAYAARLNGQYSISVDAYHRGLALKPSSIEGLSGLAQTYARMGRTEDAQKALDQVLAANPKSEVDLQLAGELLLSTDPKQALDYLHRSEAVKGSARTELLEARAYQRLGDGDSAHRMLEHARRTSPNNPEVLRAVASYYRDTGQYQESIKILEALHAGDEGTLAELGYSYSLAGDNAAAARTYDTAAALAPNDIDVQFSAAQAMINAGHFGKASDLLSHAATLNPEHYRLYALRGRLDEIQHKTADAIHEYEAAIQHLPAEGAPEGVLYPISLRVDLAEIYREAGDNTNADRVIKDATTAIASIDQTGPARPEFLRLRSATEIAAGNVDAAEKDLKEALRIEPHNEVLLLNYANLLWKTNRKEDARKTYLEAVAVDPSSPAALRALGFVSREMGDDEAAKKYFTEFAKKHPDDYQPFLALGDLYSSNRNFPQAQENYEQAFKRSPENPLVVAGAMNASLEAHQPEQAQHWLARASNEVKQNPQVMREHERYLTITGNYAESAEVGYKVVEKLPNDREGVDYLAYDLLYLNRLDDAMKIVEKYEPVLRNDRDLPLIAGHVHASHHENEAAVEDFTKALEIDPQISVGYMNRGYVYNDMRMASKAEQDFRKALALNPQYGDAHLGLAFALLQLRKSTAALKEAEIASKLLPNSEALHLVKAEGYRQRGMLIRAEAEYRKALELNPKVANTYIALADVEYRQHKYTESADTLRNALTIVPDDPMISAELARSYAQLGQPDEAMKAIETAEKNGGSDYKILIVTANVLRVMGRNADALARYSRALESSSDTRLQVRLALGRLFAQEGKPADAQQQIALGFAEARVAPIDVTSADDYLNAADILMNIHEYPLAERMYGRALALGADDAAVAVGMANAALALGDTHSAELQLASLQNDPERETNYEYLVAQGNVYRQLGQDDRALAMFERAGQLDPEDPGVRLAELELKEEAGRPITGNLGMSADARVNPIFEDENIYQLDARLLGVQNYPSLLPTPRRSIETFVDSHFQFRPNSFPLIQGFVAERNAVGTLSYPSELLIQKRNTFDTIFNISVAPNVQIGDVKFSIIPGLQYTVRRDTTSPTFINQNLFRQYVYVASNSIFDWISFSGYLIREAGPFTESPLHSRDFTGDIDFRVGRPWGKTALLTGYNGRNELFSPDASQDTTQIAEYYQTVTYAGLQRQFGTHTRVTVAAEFLRAWRITDLTYAIAQTLRPRFTVDEQIKRHWSISATGAWSSGRSFHAYDSVTSNFVATYTRERGWPWGKDANSETASLNYPLRFSFGFGQQSFYNFPGHERTQVVPVAQFNF